MQRDAGGGDHHRLWAAGILPPQDAGGQVGVGFTDAHSRVAEGDFVSEQGVQHGVAEFDLLCPHRQPLLGQKGAEDFLRFSVGLFHRVVVHFLTPRLAAN